MVKIFILNFPIIKWKQNLYYKYDIKIVFITELLISQNEKNFETCKGKNEDMLVKVNYPGHFLILNK